MIKIISSIIGVVILIVIFAWLIAGAEAQVRFTLTNIPLDVVIVKHSLSTPAESKKILYAGLKRLEELGIKSQVRTTITRDILKQNKFNQYQSRLDNWVDLAFKRGWCVEGHRCHILLPPIIDNLGLNYGGGVAHTTDCSLKGNYGYGSYSITRMKNARGVPRFFSSITSLAHELGHANGAEHTQVIPNIMHYDAQRFGEIKLPWVENTKLLVDACLYDEGIRKTSLYGFGGKIKIRSVKHGKVVQPIYE